MKSIDGESKEDNEAVDICRQLRFVLTIFAEIKSAGTPYFGRKSRRRTMQMLAVF